MSDNNKKYFLKKKNSKMDLKYIAIIGLVVVSLALSESAKVPSKGNNLKMFAGKLQFHLCHLRFKYKNYIH